MPPRWANPASGAVPATSSRAPSTGTAREHSERGGQGVPRNGYEAGSLDDVAAALGLRKASLYYYVERKSDLLPTGIRAGHLRREERSTAWLRSRIRRSA